MNKLIAILPNGSKRYVTEIMPDDIKLSIYPTDALTTYNNLEYVESIGANIGFLGKFAIESTLNAVKDIASRINDAGEIELIIKFTNDTFQAMPLKQPCTPRQMCDALILLADNIAKEVDNELV